ncbi:MAG TPA: hypothetical protein VNW47_16405 [Terriglobales bacterium]|nr:hypothetical protein [Terriglobales bacterium]
MLISPVLAPRVLGKIALVGLASWLGLCASARAQINFDQAATLRWYADNAITSFPIGNSPAGIAFDGACMWVASRNDLNVTKIHVNDGTIERVTDLGTHAGNVAFDGFNIWVVLPDTNQLAKVSAADGVVVGKFQFPPGIKGIAYDGTRIWVSEDRSLSQPGAVWSVDVTTGRAFNGADVGVNPVAMAYDGANLWVVNQDSNTVTKVRGWDATVLGTFAVGTSPSAIAFDGTTMWVTSQGGNSITRLNLNGGKVAGYKVSSPTAIAFDGVDMWVTSSTSNTLMKLNGRDGKLRGTFPAGSAPSAIAFDGANIWVVNGNSGTVSKM